MKRIFFVSALLIQVASFAQKSETVNTLITHLRAYSIPSSSVRYYTTDKGQEGFWYFDASDLKSADNTGTILVSTNGKRYKRIFEGRVNVKWFGAKGDGVTDDSPALQSAIDYFTSIGGATILIPEGVFRLKDIHVKSNITITSNQTAKSTWMHAAATIIRPALGATKIFIIDSLSLNGSIEHQTIDGLAYTFPSLAMAIDLNGKNSRLYDNNVTNVAGTALSIGSVQLARIDQNDFQGHALTPTLTGFTGGGLHVRGVMMDSDITGNEIGAGSTYKTLKNASRYSVGAYFQNISTSNIRDNIFENGDIGGYIKYGSYNNFSGNRWEVNAAEGLVITDLNQSNFIGERFTNNSSSSEGTYDHLSLGAKTFGLRFTNPIFSLLDIPATGNRKTRHAISNARSNVYLPNTLLSPYYYELAYRRVPVNVSAGYYPLNHIDEKALISAQDERAMNSIKVSSAQKSTIARPAAGMTIYCTDCPATDKSLGVMQTYNGIHWKNHW